MPTQKILNQITLIKIFLGEFFINKNYEKFVSFLFLIFIFLQVDSNANDLTESIQYAIKNNDEIKIMSDQLDNLKLSKKLVISEFLPNISVNIQKGRRQTKSYNEGVSDIGNFESKEINLEQEIFSGFSTKINLTKNQKEYLVGFNNLNAKKQNVAHEVAKLYFSILNQKKILNLYNKILAIYQKIIANEKIKLTSKSVSKHNLIEFENELFDLKQKIKEEELILVKYQLDFQNISHLDSQNLDKVSNDEISALPTISKVDILSKINNNFLLKAKYLEYQLTLDDVDSRVGEFLPKISLVANIAKQKNNLFLRGQNLTTKSIGLNLSIPIFQNGREYFNYESTKNLSKISLENYQLVRANIALELSKYCDEFISLSLNQNICKDALSNMREQENMAKIELELKSIDILKLLKIQIKIHYQKIKCQKLYNLAQANYFVLMSMIGGFDV